MSGKVELQSLNISKLVSYCEAIKNMPEPNLTRGYLEAKSRIISQLWDQINATHSAIFETTKADQRKMLDYFVNDEFDIAFNMYDEITVRIQKKLDKLKRAHNQPPIINPPENLNANLNKANIKLKPISLPQFSGDYKAWISFQNTFESLVHKNTELTGLQKLYYLKSCLSGEASRLIDMYAISEDNYETAYRTIQERYHNQNILVDTHLIALISQPNLSRETADGIKGLLDVTNENIQALNSLEVSTASWNPILLILLVPKLDPASKHLWDLTLKPRVRPTFKEFLSFLGTRFHALGCQQGVKISVKNENERSSINEHKSSFHRKNNATNSEFSFSNRITQHQQHSQQKNRNNFQRYTPAANRPCPICPEEFHSIFSCQKFRSATPPNKLEMVTAAQLCKKCLRHHKAPCTQSEHCRRCGKGHHTFLHLDENEHFNLKSQNPSIQTNSYHTNVKDANSANTTSTTEVIEWNEPTLLATALILVKSELDGHSYTLRCVLDQASETSYISEATVKLLKLNREKIEASTSGLGGTMTNVLKMVTTFEIRSKHKQDFKLKVQAAVVKKVTNPLPSILLDKTSWKHIENLQLADPHFDTPGKIDLLLGAQVCSYLLLPGLIKSSPEIPVAQNTELGWIVSGATRSLTAKSPTNAPTCLHVRLSLDDQLRKFFDQEETSRERVLSQEDKDCENFFQDTFQRDKDGRFIVALPFKRDPSSLGSSKLQAISRLKHLEARFRKNKILKDEYTTILKEYTSLNHSSLLGNLYRKPEPSNNTTAYHLPHHAVFKPDSTTTKTRIVFDASAKTTNGTSLNDLLMKGPTFQDDICSILLRWRMHRIVFAADITKMYRQIKVREQDRKFQRYLFRENENDEIQEFEHDRVTFGVASATYLAIKSLRQLAVDEKEKYPEAAEVVLNDFYMDDVMSGADTAKEAIELCKDLKKLLASGKFELRKFISNSTAVLQSLPETDRELKMPLELTFENTIKTLGLQHHPVSDTFQFKINFITSTDWPTKRSVLSETSKLFDPLGWLAPVIIRAKMLFQELWQEGLTWDDKLPKTIADKWLTFREELHLIEKIRIKRWNGRLSNSKICELHGFSDASEKAFSAVIYSRVVSQDGVIQVSLLSAKTRVAPLQTISIPRLELQGSVLLANLMGSVGKALNINTTDMHAWTDSTIVLGWLRTHPSKLKTFVANRVVEIHDFLNVGQWHHIESENNPADCASRGIKPSELVSHKLWWNGPDCLRNHNVSWEQNLTIPPVSLELKSVITKSTLLNITESSGDVVQVEKTESEDVTRGRTFDDEFYQGTILGYSFA